MTEFKTKSLLTDNSFRNLTFDASYRPEKIIAINGKFRLHTDGMLGFTSTEPQASFKVPFATIKSLDFTNSSYGSFRIITTDGYKYSVSCTHTPAFPGNGLIAISETSDAIARARSLERAVAGSLPPGAYIPSRPIRWFKVLLVAGLLVAVPVALFAVYVAFFFKEPAGV